MIDRIDTRQAKHPPLGPLPMPSPENFLSAEQLAPILALLRRARRAVERGALLALAEDSPSSTPDAKRRRARANP